MAALLASGIRRGLCAVGSCYQCVATIDGVRDRRTCRVPAKDGMRIAFDGAADDAPTAGTPSAASGIPHNDIVIVGAGPAGASCAQALAGEGIATTLLDDNASAGGQIWRKATTGSPGDALRARLAGTQAVAHVPGAEVVDLRDGREIWLVDAHARGHVLKPRFVVAATGAIERNVAVPGWDLPGVFNLGGLQALLKGQGVVPEGPVLLAGAGPLLYLVADDLRAAGVPLAAVVDSAPGPDLPLAAALARVPSLAARALGFVWRLRRAGVPILQAHRVVRMAKEGGALRATVERTGGGARREFVVGNVGLGFGLRANTELAQVAGARLVNDAGLGGWHAWTDADCRTSVASLFAIGEARGIRGVEAALCDAAIAAAAIVAQLGRVPSQGLQAAARRAAGRGARYESAARALSRWAHVPESSTDAATVLCRCEGATRGDLDAAHALDLSAPGAIKLATRAGMGLCQGRVCAEIAATGAGDAPRARFPLRPCPADAFGPEILRD